MEIKREILASWKEHYKHGDYMLIADKFCTKYQRISQQLARKWVQTAFKTGIVDERLYPIIEKFYADIEKKLKQVK
jgi:hypothetical protein